MKCSQNIRQEVGFKSYSTFYISLASVVWSLKIAKSQRVFSFSSHSQKLHEITEQKLINSDFVHFFEDGTKRKIPS